MLRTEAEFRKLGERARQAKAAVDAAFRDRLRDRDPRAYGDLVLAFHAAVAAALPSARAGFVEGLAARQRQDVETAVAFLEADPWFFRSGYEKQNLIKHLKRMPLDELQRQRLGRVVLAVIDGRDRSEFRHFCRLAIAVWSDALAAEVDQRCDSPDAAIRRRAMWVLMAVFHAGKL